MVEVRRAGEDDVGAIFALDDQVWGNEARQGFIRRSVGAGQCWVAQEGAALRGYVVLVYSFFGNGFVDLLYVAPDARRQGVGAALMRHMEQLCREPKLFTSTNLSNLPMQSLLATLGYALSGVIHNLDEGDPELVYFKSVAGEGQDRNTFSTMAN